MEGERATIVLVRSRSAGGTRRQLCRIYAAAGSMSTKADAPQHSCIAAVRASLQFVSDMGRLSANLQIFHTQELDPPEILHLPPDGEIQV